jgi:uncharacterized protein
LQKEDQIHLKPEIAYLWQHDTYKPLGKLMVLREDNFGLYFEAKMSDTTWGEDALKLYRDGVITQHSIGYQVIKVGRNHYGYGRRS